MKNINQQKEDDIITALLGGGIGILPTDTLYGIVGSALSREVVEKIYVLRKRDLEKPMIILIASLEEISLFGIMLDKRNSAILEKIWPGKVSVVLPCEAEKFAYLHRGKKTLAFRVPQDKWLRDLLVKTGPLVAPSANMEGMEPALTVGQARKYFGEKVDFYLDYGERQSEPSTIVKFNGNKLEVIREGAVKIDGKFFE